MAAANEDNTPQEWTPSYKGRFLALGAILALGVGAAAFFALETPDVQLDTRRVVLLVSVDRPDGRLDAWWSGRGPVSSQWNQHYAKQIRDLGLFPVSPTDPALQEALLSIDAEASSDPDAQTKTGMALAKATNAAWVVIGHIGARDLGPTHKVREESSYEIQARLTLVSAISGPTTALSPNVPGRYVLGSDQEIHDALTRQVADEAVIPLAQGIVGHPTFRRYLDGKNIKDTQFAARLDTLIGKAALADDAFEVSQDTPSRGHKAHAAVGATSVKGAVGNLIGVAPDGTIWLQTPSRTFRYEGLDPEGSWFHDGMWLTSLAPGSATPKRHVYTRVIEEIQRPRLSADGSIIAYLTNHVGSRDTLEVLTTATGAGRILHRIEGNISDPMPSPDGQQIVFSARVGQVGPTSLYVIDLKGGEPRLLIEAETFVQQSLPRWHPDGKRLFLDAHSPNDPNVSLVSLDVATGARTVVRQLKPKLEAIEDGDDDSEVAFAGEGDDVPDIEAPPDDETETEAGTEVEPEAAPEIDYKAIAVPGRNNPFVNPLPTPDGEALLVIERDLEDWETYLGVWTPDTDTYQRALTTPVKVQGRVISPDGKMIALWGAVQSKYGTRAQVAIIDIAKRAVVYVVPLPFGERAAFAPDNRTLYVDVVNESGLHVIRLP
ncbi:MAG: hypothetical protein ACI9MR_005135 [Myxococcota bacterium]|jgi:hypothetical protein